MNPARIFIAIGLMLTCIAVIAAQSTQYPNELEGYEFFGKGKLKDLKLGSSRKADVEKIFGQACEEECDYDDEFSIIFHYVSALDSCVRTKSRPDSKMCPRTEVVGSNFDVWLAPKRERGFQDPSSTIFSERGGGMPKPDERGNVESFTAFDDSFGLTYVTFSVENISSRDRKEKKVRLLSISYSITEDFINEAFTVDYPTRKSELTQ